ncbi:hypothetical protein WME89_50305 [Sorangium sp. So ce321]|uniref:hypothetical protein n=1 Tax=Sorangium sp. So ce321 TaxID=3133300 RepID=UPI003F5DBBF5
MPHAGFLLSDIDFSMIHAGLSMFHIDSRRCSLDGCSRNTLLGAWSGGDPLDLFLFTYSRIHNHRIRRFIPVPTPTRIDTAELELATAKARKKIDEAFALLAP